MSFQRRPLFSLASGFTLIELVVVIVILGILAATALPKFVDLRAEADDAALAGIAGAISTAFAVNYAAYGANPAKAIVINDALMCNPAARNDINRLLASPLPPEYSIDYTGVVNDSRNCSLKSNEGRSGVCKLVAASGRSTTYTHVCVGGTK